VEPTVALRSEQRIEQDGGGNAPEPSSHLATAPSKSRATPQRSAIIIFSKKLSLSSTLAAYFAVRAPQKKLPICRNVFPSSKIQPLLYR